MTTIPLPIYRAPLIKQGWLRVIIFCIAFAILMVLTALIAGFMSGVVMAASRSKTGADTSSLLVLLMASTSIMSVLLVFAFNGFIDRRSVNSLGFTWKGYQADAGTGFLLPFVILGIGTLILYFTGHLRWTDAKFSASEFFISLVLMILVAAGEELVFRGYILNNLMQSVDKWTAFGISTALFTLAHINNPGITTLTLINVLLGGALLGLNYIYTRNLWFCLLFHFSWNFLQGAVLGYDVSGIGVNSILEIELTGSPFVTGGFFGFEGSIINTGLVLTTILLLYLFYEKRYKAR